MRQSYLYPSILIVLALSPEGQAQPSETTKLLDEHIALGRASAELLAQVKDKQSATQSAPALQRLVERFALLSKNMQALAVLSETDARAMRQRYEMPLRESWGKVYHEIYRIQKAQSYGSHDFVKTFQLFCKLLDQ